MPLRSLLALQELGTLEGRSTPGAGMKLDAEGNTMCGRRGYFIRSSFSFPASTKVSFRPFYRSTGSPNQGTKPHG